MTANNASRAYGAANPAFSATLSGFVGGQMLASSGVTGTAACASTANATTNAGVYGPETAQAITCAQGSLTATNYDFTPFTKGTLTINPAASTTRFGPVPAPRYPGPNFRVFGLNNSGGTITFSKVSGFCDLVDRKHGHVQSNRDRQLRCTGLTRRPRSITWQARHSRPLRFIRCSLQSTLVDQIGSRLPRLMGSSLQDLFPNPEAGFNGQRPRK